MTQEQQIEVRRVGTPSSAWPELRRVLPLTEAIRGRVLVFETDEYSMHVSREDFETWIEQTRAALAEYDAAVAAITAP